MSNGKKELFTNTDLRKLIIPLFVEQFLVMLVGIADTFFVSFASEAAVSGVSLVNSFNTVLVFLFTALSAGGAVIVSQYIGSENRKQAGKSASQLLMIMAVISGLLAMCILIFHTHILTFLFGKVDADVMAACEIYLKITTWSLPALAVYESGAAMCRSVGKTQVTMYISTVANIVNIIGDAVGIFVFHQGAAGVAVPSLISRILSAMLVTIYCFNRKDEVRYTVRNILTWDGGLLKKIMSIAIPNGVENGVHQLVKVALSSMVALFGTYQIAANGVAQSIWSLASIMGLAMAPVYTTVIGQCMGARDIESANFYFKKLGKLTFILSVAWNGFIFVITPFLLRFFAISDQTKALVIILVLINNIFNGIAYPFSGPMGNGLRAAGDVRFTMLVSISLTIGARFFFSMVFGIWMNMGVIGIAIGMSMDLVFKGAIFIWRYRSQKWTRFQVI